MNNIFKYIYVILIAIIIIELIYLASKIFSLNKIFNILGTSFKSIDNKLNDTKKCIKKLENNSKGWKLILKIYLTFSILKKTSNEYKKTKEPNKKYLKTLIIVCAKNINTINKIKTI